MSAPSTRTVPQTLPKARLLELARVFGVTVPPEATRDAQAEALASAGVIRFRELLASLGRDELKAACRTQGLDDTGCARPLLASRLLHAHGASESAPPKPLFTANAIPRYAPHKGDIVQVRHRQWLVEDVVPPPAEGHATRVRLVCLDDDNQGRDLEVLWELELGAKVHQPEAHGLGTLERVDPPRHFAAYLHALKWNCVHAVGRSQGRAADGGRCLPGATCRFLVPVLRAPVSTGRCIVRLVHRRPGGSRSEWTRLPRKMRVPSPWPVERSQRAARERRGCAEPCGGCGPADPPSASQPLQGRPVRAD